MIQIVLKPHVERGGFHLDRFDAFRDGELIVCSRQPAYDGARALINAGVDPDEQVEVITAGGIAWPPQRIGELAKWTVEETNRDGVHRRKWRPAYGMRRKDA